MSHLTPENALEYEWSNGQLEGQASRLKLIKRQMYGRAEFDLLRARASLQIVKLLSKPSRAPISVSSKVRMNR